MVGTFYKELFKTARCRCVARSLGAWRLERDSTLRPSLYWMKAMLRRAIPRNVVSHSNFRNCDVARVRYASSDTDPKIPVRSESPTSCHYKPQKWTLTGVAAHAVHLGPV